MSDDRGTARVPLVPSAATPAAPCGSLRCRVEGWERRWTGRTTGDGEPVGTLRGAGVQVDAARAARLALTVGLVALVVTGAVLVVAGYRKNSQVDELRAGSVPVRVTVVHCLGLMGGSGSNAAGYECTGTYVVHGRTYVEGIPGSTYYPGGTVVAGVVPTGDAGLLSTPSAVAASHDSVVLYVVGGVLLGVAAGIVAWLVLRRRRVRPTD